MPCFPAAWGSTAAPAAKTLYEAGKSLRLRMFRLPIAGELQSGVIDGTWLRDRSAIWPANAAAYKCCSAPHRPC